MPTKRFAHKPAFAWGASCVLAGALLATTSGCRRDHSEIARSSTRQQLDFNQDVQPILASNCFSCHGPDPEMRKANLRLDLEESAFRKRPGKPDAIVPGKPGSSEIIRRIESKDPHYLMPQSPQGEAKPMKPEEIAILRQWIAEGAHYRPHWAFEKPTRPAVPQLKAAAWAQTPMLTQSTHSSCASSRKRVCTLLPRPISTR